LPLRIGLPIDFIEDEVKRLRFYQLLTNSENLSELDQHFARLPRPWPATVKNLRYVLEIKILARAAAITSIDTQLLANQEKKLIITCQKKLIMKKSLTCSATTLPGNLAVMI
jgi:transcription-repair coupling factor (superfamily II helicase)